MTNITTMPDLNLIVGSAVSGRKLRPRDDLFKTGWHFWGLRSLNMHRIVGLLQDSREFSDAHDLEIAIRGAVSHNFKVSWWRGMGYGIVAEVSVTAFSLDDLKTLVDGRENPKGTLQWVILIARDSRVAVGVHTWMEAYLSPVYRQMVQVLQKTAFQVASARKEKDGLMKFLTGVADMNAALTSFGTRTEAFPEFRDYVPR